MSIAFVSAVVPVVLLLFFIYRKDKYQPEPLGKLLLAFFVGCLSVIPAAMMEGVIMIAAPSAEYMPVLNGLFNGYLVAGLSEELCKLLLLLLVIWKSPHFDEFFDGIVYAAYLSLGFACVENIMYVFQGDDQMATALARGLLAVPAHFLFAVTMGYYVSLAKFDPGKKGGYLFKAFLYPMLLHGTYDALLMVSSNLANGMEEESAIIGGICLILFVVFIIFDIRLWRKGLKRIKKMQERSKEQGFDRLHPFDGFTWDV
ncbi:MAG: PrsW family intramembrane metalloprotease [Bacteroidales bacterium]|nr:PrsW family intramembrane metalloprotease [Bacteroidales bacterium]